MSFLDLYQQDARDATATQPGEKTQLPATFSEGFDAALRENQLFRQSISGETARQQALQDHIDDVQRRTGHDLAKDIDYSGAGFGGALTADMLREQVNAAARKAGQPELDAGALEQAAMAKSRSARSDYAEMAGREKTGGGTAGFILGNLAGAATDPINVLALPVAPAEGLGILATGLRWAALGGVSQAAIEVAAQDFHEKVQPGYTESGEPLLNIAEAAGGAAVFGGGIKAAGNAWTRVKTGQWPRSIRDAGNIVESEANVAQTNLMPGVVGEATHREALTKAIDDLIAGRPIGVDVPPELWDAAQKLMVRLEGERAMALPILDERAIRLTSEEAGLRTRDAELAGQFELPAGSQEAAAKLARLNSIEQQIGEATGRDRKTLQDRRDELLADTTPESLRTQAAPLELRRAADAERASIAARMETIAAERAKMQAEGIFSPPATVGQTQPVRQVPVMDLRARMIAAADAAKAERAAGAGEAAPQLPFVAGAKEAEAEKTAAALADGIVQIAAQAGHNMPREQAEFIARHAAQAPPEQAAQILQEAFLRPRTLADTLPSVAEATRERRGINRNAIWANKDFDVPVQIVDEAPHKGPDGRTYQKVRYAGRESYVPSDELRPSKSAPSASPEADAALAKETTPAALEKLRAEPELDESILRDLDRLRAEKGDVAIPMGEEVNAAGERVAVSRKIESVLAEADDRLAASREIALCAGPQPEATP